MKIIHKPASCGMSTINIIDWLLENDPQKGWNPYKHDNPETKELSQSDG